MEYKKLEFLLDKKGLTASALARELNFSAGTLHAWKTGEYTPKMDKIKRICKYFGVPLSYFIQEENTEKKEVLNSSDAELIEAFNKLTPDMQKQIKGLVRSTLELQGRLK